MSRFRVALSGDFRQPDGSPTYPSFDLSPLRAIRASRPCTSTRSMASCPPTVSPAATLILLMPRFTRASVPADGRLAVVARFGVGYDSVDVQACTDSGIALVITPDGVRRPVAVSILTFVLALSQKLLIKDRLCRQGPEGWAKRSEHMGEGLVGRTLGQLGMGNIGAEVFRLAQPFGMRFVAHDPYQDPAVAAELGVELVGLEELFRRADFLSVSVPLSEATRHIVGERLLGLMKPTAYLINTSPAAPSWTSGRSTRAGGGADRRRRPRRVRGRAVPRRRADPEARQRHRHAARALLDRRVLRRQRRRRRPRGARGDAGPGAGGRGQPRGDRPGHVAC